MPSSRPRCFIVALAHEPAAPALPAPAADRKITSVRDALALAPIPKKGIKLTDEKNATELGHITARLEGIDFYAKCA